MKELKKALKNDSNGNCKVVKCPTGSGKTTIIMYDAIWRMTDESIKSGNEDNIIIFSTPDKSINDEVEFCLNEIFKSKKTIADLKEKGISLRNIINEPKELTGIDLEILVCSVQKLTRPENIEFLKNKKILCLINDEAHKGLGSPIAGEENTYKEDVGHHGKAWEAKWFTSLKSLTKTLWIALSATPTASMKNQTEFGGKYYETISEKMETAEYRKPFFDNEVTQFQLNENRDQIEFVFKKVAMEISKSQYIKSQIKPNLFEIPELEEAKKIKTTALIKCGVKGSKWLKPTDVAYIWNDLKDIYEDKTFLYCEEGEAIELPYYIGDIALLQSEYKTLETNQKTFNELNDENSNYVAAAVIYIGTVGINVLNLSTISCLPVIKNAGSVDINIDQLIGRLDRCRFNWHDIMLAIATKVKNKRDQELLIRLLTMTSSKRCCSTIGGMFASTYYDRISEGRKV